LPETNHVATRYRHDRAAKMPGNGATDHRARILIMDDEPTFLKWSSDLLRDHGYECTSVPDAATAGKSLKQSHYDLLIAGVFIAGNLQLEFVKEVSEKEEGFPVILVTGLPTAQTAIEAIRLSVIAYLVKPLECERLLGEVRAGVNRFRFYRTVQKTLYRFEAGCQSLRDIWESLDRMPKTMLAAPLTAFFTLTMHKIVHGLLDWTCLTETLLESKDPQEAVKAAEGALLKEQRDLLEEAIRTLEKTKVAFKSKELGKLRERMEGFLKII
jgi:response regulator RpfG family c-di-GMP phosphodiesterase